MAKKNRVDLNQLYAYYLTRYGGAEKEGASRQAAQNTAFQYLDNPTGSIKGIKEPPKWYSQDEWINFSAPDYSSMLSYTGANQLNIYVRDQFKARTAPNRAGKIKRITLQDASDIATGAQQLPAVIGESRLSTGDIYTQVKDLVLQYSGATKNYEQQKNTHVYSQYGLDPNQRYVISRNKVKDNFVLYEPAAKYVQEKQNAYGSSLLKQGYSQADAQKYSDQYGAKLEAALQIKLDASPLTPFIDKVMQLRKAAGKGK